MFGFLKPLTPVPEWRRSYARVCQYQRELFGLASLPFLSYEATFLYQLGMDFGCVPELSDDHPTCCRLRSIRRSDGRLDQDAARFAAAFGILLLGIKLDDDVQDQGRWQHRALRWKYSGAVRKASAVLDSLAPGLVSQIRTVLEAHQALESRKDVSLVEYAVPTADGFRLVFEAFANCVADPTVAERFSVVGHSVGRSMIAWDCAVDFDTDQFRGDFNPLTDQRAVERSFDDCRLNLARVGWELPEGSASSSVVASVIRRVIAKQESIAPSPLRKLERWGLIRQRGHVYAKCDVCDCCCCIEGGADCLGGSVCCIDDLCCLGCGPSRNGCGEPCFTGSNSTRQESGSSTQDRPYRSFESKVGVATGPLNPAGFLQIDDERIPAKSSTGRWISEGTECVVVSSDGYGVSVRPTSEVNT